MAHFRVRERRKAHFSQGRRAAQRAAAWFHACRPALAVEIQQGMNPVPDAQEFGLGKYALLKKALTGDAAVYCTVPDTATVYDAVEVMNTANKGVALDDAEDRVAGLFTERDFVTRVIDEGVSTKDVPITDVMTERSFIFSMGPEGTVGEALKVMLEKRFRHLPVMEGEKVLGVVTIRELVRVMKEDDNLLGGAYPLASLPEWPRR